MSRNLSRKETSISEKDSFITASTLNEAFKQVCLKFSNSISLQFKAEGEYHYYTYQQIFDLSNKVGCWLSKQDIKKGEHIALILENSPYWAVIYFGIILSGAVCVPIDPQLTSEEVMNILNDSQSYIIFTNTKVIKSLEGKDNFSDIRKRIIIDYQISDNSNINFLDIISQDISSKDISLPEIQPHDLASIIYTSGTTALPKGVMLTHENFMANFNSISNLNICSSKDNFICFLPLFHAYAFMGTLIFPLFTGAKITYLSSLKSQDLLDCINSTQVTFVAGVPELFYNIHSAIFNEIKKLSFLVRFILDLIMEFLWLIRKLTHINLAKFVFKKIHSKFGNSLRYFVSGGARLDPAVATDLFKLGFTVLEGYGLTETSPIATMSLPKKFKIGSVGMAIPDVAIKIVNPDSYGIGEVVIQGNNVMKGYYRRESETKQIIKEGWFYSGDLGYLDRDNFLYLTGRSKEVIVLSSGKNIYPEELEEYYSHSPFIKELCILGIEEDRNITSLKAIVVPDFEYFQKHGEINIQARIKWDLENFSRNLASYKRVMGFMISKEALPRTRLGKVKRYLLRDRYIKELKEQIKPTKQAPSKEDLEILASPIASKIIDYISKRLSLKRPLNLDDHLELDLAIDSLSRVEMIMGLESLFNISVPDTALMGVSTVRALIQKITELVLRCVNISDISQVRLVNWKEILRVSPDKETIKKIELNPNLFNQIFTRLFMKSLFLIFKTACRLKIEGAQFIPTKGPFILCANHSSYLDGFVIVASVPFSVELNLFFMGARNIFQHPSIKWSNKIARLLPVDPASELVKAMQVSSFLLRHKKMLCIFPEGQRSIDGKIGDFKKGIGILAKELDAQILPTAIIGTHRAWPRAVKFPKPASIRIIFGQPKKYIQLIQGLDTSKFIDEYEAIAYGLRQEVLRLFEKRRND